MFARVYGATILGLQGNMITVETDIANGLPAFEIVGMAATSVKESKERVRASMKNSGYEFPMRRITLNLAPAELKKDSTGLDLAIAIGIMVSSGQIPPAKTEGCLFVGELSLDGNITASFPCSFRPWTRAFTRSLSVRRTQPKRCSARI